MATRKLALLMSGIIGSLMSISSISHSAEKVGQAVKINVP
jgi:hypothetical protein